MTCASLLVKAHKTKTTLQASTAVLARCFAGPTLLLFAPVLLPLLPPLPLPPMWPPVPLQLSPLPLWLMVKARALAGCSSETSWVCLQPRTLWWCWLTRIGATLGSPVHTAVCSQPPPLRQLQVRKQRPRDPGVLRAEARELARSNPTERPRN